MLDIYQEERKLMMPIEVVMPTVPSTADPDNFIAKRASEEIRDLLLKIKKTNSPILLLLSGGSSLKILTHLDSEILNNKIINSKVTIAPLDERYTKSEEGSNWKQIEKTDFFQSAKKQGVQFIETVPKEIIKKLPIPIPEQTTVTKRPSPKQIPPAPSPAPKQPIRPLAMDNPAKTTTNSPPKPPSKKGPPVPPTPPKELRGKAPVPPKPPATLAESTGQNAPKKTLPPLTPPPSKPPIPPTAAKKNTPPTQSKVQGKIKEEMAQVKSNPQGGKNVKYEERKVMESLEEFAQRFETAIEKWIKDNPNGKIVSIVGIGKGDKHVAGIIPGDPDHKFNAKFVTNQQLITHHEISEDKNPFTKRITPTLNFFTKNIDYAFFYAVDKEKEIKEIFMTEPSKRENYYLAPALIMWKMKNVKLFTDTNV